VENSSTLVHGARKRNKINCFAKVVYLEDQDQTYTREPGEYLVWRGFEIHESDESRSPILITIAEDVETNDANKAVRKE
jgi:hypothetical protein